VATDPERARALLAEALAMRPALRETLASDADLASLL
jgi:hypothetical protein